MAEAQYSSSFGDASPAAPAEEKSSAPRASEPMDDEAFRSVVKASIDDAVDYIDGFIAPLRGTATKYYRGDSFGNEEEGRSQFVMTEVRDKVLSVLPDMMRTITSSENMGEFAANNAQQEDQANQQTEYVNHILHYDNPGFMIVHSVLKDGLVRKTGIAKWRWSEDREITEQEYSGLDQSQMTLLHATPDVEILEMTPRQEQMPAMEGQPEQTIIVYDTRIRRTVVNKQRVVVEAVPPEEFIVSRETRSIDTSPYIGHRAMKTISELVAMGYDRDELDEYAGQGDVFVLNYEAQTRNPSINSFLNQAPSSDEAMQKALYVESFVRVDRDGDGIAELRRVCTLGGAAHILHEEIVTEVPFAFFCPDPEPHMLIGQSLADQVMDIQLLASNVIRTTLDSLSESIRPRIWFVEGQANADDVQNNEVGALIRVRQPGMVGEFTRTFLGQQAMPVIQWLDDLSARRTGVTPASQGLDADAMQSTTAKAVDATVAAAQSRVEMMVRIFAEGFLKQLMRGVRNLVCQHQDRPRSVRLRGQWANVDPRTWDADLDVHVNVALGRGTDQDKIQNLKDLITKMEQMIQLFGPANPISDMTQLADAYAQVATLQGYKNPQKFFKKVPVEILQQIMQQNQNKPDPNMLVAQAEMQKVQLQADKNRNDFQLGQMKNYQDFVGRIAEINARYQTNIQVAQLEAQIDQASRMHEAHVQAGVDVHANQMNAAVQAQSAQQGANGASSPPAQ